MGYLGTCVVCGEPITDVHDLAWVAPLSLGGPRRRAHAGTCAERAEVQAGPKIEGYAPAPVEIGCPYCGGVFTLPVDEASPSDGERKGADDGTRG